MEVYGIGRINGASDRNVIRLGSRKLHLKFVLGLLYSLVSQQLNLFNSRAGPSIVRFIFRARRPTVISESDDKPSASKSIMTQ
ncbi:hypothetical protein OUZ56_001429 [Daphnia magna]|uniref:Uncharacterized protein n=1 Tax=Daphnia magna TaxID=35525 RepID=A0ABR0A2M3_9CRUS|nr:hypothetical protein OUZ56_001429 [Daphnia magna]